MANRHPLTGDFQMYYRGTYVCQDGPQGYSTMYVEAVTNDGDDRILSNLRFIGRVCSPEGVISPAPVTWAGDQLSVRVPRYGYYQLPGLSGPVYLSYQAQNRTNRKGLDPRTILFNSRSREVITHQQVNTLFNQCGFPGSFGRDLCVFNNNLMWKGTKVGLLVSGDVTLLNKYEPLREMLCEQLGKFLTVRQVTVQ